MYSYFVSNSCRALDNKWKERGELIGQLETQVRQVKQTFDEKEQRLTEERDKALKAERYVPIGQLETQVWQIYNSIQFNSIQFNSIQFNSIQFNSIQCYLFSSHNTVFVISFLYWPNLLVKGVQHFPAFAFSCTSSILLFCLLLLLLLLLLLRWK